MVLNEQLIQLKLHLDKSQSMLSTLQTEIALVRKERDDAVSGKSLLPNAGMTQSKATAPNSITHTREAIFRGGAGVSSNADMKLIVLEDLIRTVEEENVLLKSYELAFKCRKLFDSSDAVNKVTELRRNPPISRNDLQIPLKARSAIKKAELFETRSTILNIEKCHEPASGWISRARDPKLQEISRQIERQQIHKQLQELDTSIFDQTWSTKVGDGEYITFGKITLPLLEQLALRQVKFTSLDQFKAMHDLLL